MVCPGVGCGIESRHGAAQRAVGQHEGQVADAIVDDLVPDQHAARVGPGDAVDDHAHHAFLETQGDFAGGPELGCRQGRDAIAWLATVSEAGFRYAKAGQIKAVPVVGRRCGVRQQAGCKQRAGGQRALASRPHQRSAALMSPSAAEPGHRLA